MSNFYMTVGLPASGKSTYAHLLGCEVVSSDAIRLELFGDENDQNHNGEVFNELHRRIRSAINENKDVVYDATNLSRKRRKNFLKTLPKDVRKICICMCTDYNICLIQNSQRSRNVPEDVLFNMYKNISIPILTEGWDEIQYIQHGSNRAEREFYMDYNQDNPRHSLTLGQHMSKARSYILQNYAIPDSGILACAAQYHDIGKPVCKTYKTYSGKIDDHAHYYNHADVGAYIYLCYPDTPKQYISLKEYPIADDALNIALLISQHMIFFDSNHDKIMDDLAKSYGDKFVEDLKALHEADLFAH